MIEKLTKIICEHIGNNDVTITKDTVLIADLGLNSLDLVNLACIVEDEFDIQIPDREIKNLKTVGDVIAFIKKQ
ncbi:MAG: acyl carrier protein [Oscillospiraceae bacterium]|nr:acyl carrier protein [Oscillospiraceae bacterium]